MPLNLPTRRLFDVCLRPQGHFDFQAAVRKEIALGASIDAKDERGNTPLMCSLWKANGELASTLLALNADPKEANNAGETSLMAAAYAGLSGECEELLRRGVDIDACDRDNQTALMMAIRCEQWALCECLASPAGINIRSSDGHTAVMLASYVGEWELCRKLIELGAEISDDDWHSKHHLASLYAAIKRLVCQRSFEAGDVLRDDGKITDAVLFASANVKQWQNIAHSLEKYPEIYDLCWTGLESPIQTRLQQFRSTRQEDARKEEQMREALRKRSQFAPRPKHLD